MKKQKNNKSALKRAGQLEKLITVAESAIASGGLSELKARELAEQAGMALGQIYNLVADMDELILKVGSRTLERLEARLEAALVCLDADPQTHLITIAMEYHHFARDNYHLWRSLFDARVAQGKPLPEWVSHERLRPFRFVEQPLSSLMPDRSQEQIALFAQSIFSAIHGMVSLAFDGRTVGVQQGKLDEQIRLLLWLLCRGLASPVPQPLA